MSNVNLSQRDAYLLCAVPVLIQLSYDEFNAVNNVEFAKTLGFRRSYAYDICEKFSKIIRKLSRADGGGWKFSDFICAQADECDTLRMMLYVQTFNVLAKRAGDKTSFLAHTIVFRMLLSLADNCFLQATGKRIDAVKEIVSVAAYYYKDVDISASDAEVNAAAPSASELMKMIFGMIASYDKK